MSDEYRGHLKTLTVVELKALIRKINSTYIPFSKMKKLELIDAIIKHHKMSGTTPTFERKVVTEKVAKEKVAKKIDIPVFQTGLTVSQWASPKKQTDSTLALIPEQDDIPKPKAKPWSSNAIYYMLRDYSPKLFDIVEQYIQSQVDKGKGVSINNMLKITGPKYNDKLYISYGMKRLIKGIAKLVKYINNDAKVLNPYPNDDYTKIPLGLFSNTIRNSIIKSKGVYTKESFSTADFWKEEEEKEKAEYKGYEDYENAKEKKAPDDKPKSTKAKAKKTPK